MARLSFLMLDPFYTIIWTLSLFLWSIMYKHFLLFNLFLFFSVELSVVADSPSDSTAEGIYVFKDRFTNETTTYSENIEHYIDGKADCLRGNNSLIHDRWT